MINREIGSDLLKLEGCWNWESTVRLGGGRVHALGMSVGKRKESEGYGAWKW